MSLQLWKDENGQLVEVNVDSVNKIHFYRAYPWLDKDSPRLWSDMVTTSSIKHRGWTYIQDLD